MRFVAWLQERGLLRKCLSVSPRDRGGLPFLCDLPVRHWGDHEAHVFGRTVRRWPWWGGRWW